MMFHKNDFYVKSATLWNIGEKLNKGAFILTQAYKASAKQNPGRKGWLVEFRHPLRNDSNNKPGKKVRKGLGTDDQNEAEKLVEQLNELLANPTLNKIDAIKIYNEKIVEIFYSEITQLIENSIELRDKKLPLPRYEDGYARVGLLGVPGAGKTTLLRQLIGTNPKTERFPSTSTNRTTTFPTEVVLCENEDYEAVVTFMTETETRFEIEESLSSALIEAVNSDSTPISVAKIFLEKSDMRFRLKYLLGDYIEGNILAEADPYDDEETDDQNDSDTDAILTVEEETKNKSTLSNYIIRVISLAKRLTVDLEDSQGQIDAMTSEDRNAALDLIEEQAVDSDEFLELVSEILDELRTKFRYVPGGQFEKTTTGWPKSWYIKTKASERSEFLKIIRFFSGNATKSWGQLLTPLVNGLRAIGPFKPLWAQEFTRLILIDTEGLGHKSNASADLSEQALALLHDVDVILLVDNAKNGMTNFAAGKALESVINTGNTRKLAMVFTHMDTVKSDGLKGQAKYDHVFGGLRNIIENQLAQNVSIEAARHILSHLKQSTFYVGKIDEIDPKPAKPELLKLLAHLSKAQPPIFQPVVFPQYSSDHLVLAIQKAAVNFRQQWKSILGQEIYQKTKPAHWQTIKGLSRRYAVGLKNELALQPVANLVASLSAEISKYLESPLSWSTSPTEEQKRETIDLIKTIVTKELPKLSQNRLRVQAQPAWYEAYSVRGQGSTIQRRTLIEGIYQRWVPIPDSNGDKWASEFLSEVKSVVASAIDSVKQEVEQSGKKPI